MQKIVYIYDYNTGEVDTLLEKGWKIISVNPVSVAQGKAYSIAAYVVLEKNMNKNKRKSINNLSSNCCVVNANSKRPNMR